MSNGDEDPGEGAAMGMAVAALPRAGMAFMMIFMTSVTA